VHQNFIFRHCSFLNFYNINSGEIYFCVSTRSWISVKEADFRELKFYRLFYFFAPEILGKTSAWRYEGLNALV